MKTYKKVKLEAVNAPSGSYAAGCPAKENCAEVGKPKSYDHICKACERTA